MKLSTSRLVGPSAGDILLGRYRIERLIGTGPFATVFQAADLELRGACVAIKRIHPHLTTSTEVRNALTARVLEMRQLSHPNIVRTFDIEESEDHYFHLVTEYCDGWSLFQLLEDRQSRAINADAALHLLSCILLALEYAHNREVIHANLKPHNIFVTRDGVVKVSDFSLNLAFDHSDGFTVTGEGVASPTYMSPEQFTLTALTRQTDIYSWGVLAYHLLCGSGAIPDRDYMSCARTHISGELPQLFSKEKLPPVVEKILSLCCQSEPNLRPSSAKEIYDELNPSEQVKSVDSKLLLKSLSPRKVNSEIKRWRTGAVVFLILVSTTTGITLFQKSSRIGLTGFYFQLEHYLGFDAQWFKKPLNIDYSLSDPLVLHKASADNFVLEALLTVKSEDGTLDENGKSFSHLMLEGNTWFYYVSLERIGRPDTQDKAGDTPLHKVASSYHQSFLINALLKAGASPELPNNNGYIPLHRAILDQNLVGLKLLVKIKHTVNLRDKSGRTPLMLALSTFTSESQLLETIQLLLQSGATVRAYDNGGQSTLDYATTTNLPSVVSLIQTELEKQK